MTAWADAEIHRLDADGWREARRIAAFSALPAGMGGTQALDWRWTIEGAVALLAARDRVLAELSPFQRKEIATVVARPDGISGRRAPTTRALVHLRLIRDPSYVDGYRSHALPLGHEIARCIEEASDD